jgi:hypothetical protein
VLWLAPCGPGGSPAAVRGGRWGYREGTCRDSLPRSAASGNALRLRLPFDEVLRWGSCWRWINALHSVALSLGSGSYQRGFTSAVLWCTRTVRSLWGMGSWHASTIDLTFAGTRIPPLVVGWEVLSVPGFDSDHRVIQTSLAVGLERTEPRPWVLKSINERRFTRKAAAALAELGFPALETEAAIDAYVTRMIEILGRAVEEELGGTRVMRFIRRLLSRVKLVAEKARKTVGTTRANPNNRTQPSTQDQTPDPGPDPAKLARQIAAGILAGGPGRLTTARKTCRGSNIYRRTSNPSRLFPLLPVSGLLPLETTT